VLFYQQLLLQPGNSFTLSLYTYVYVCVCVYEGLYISPAIYSLMFTLHLNIDMLQVKLSLWHGLVLQNLAPGLLNKLPEAC